MKKILVQVFLPAANRNFDIYIPLEMKFYNVTVLVAKTVSELSNGLFIWNNNTVLCEKETGKILDINITVEELGLRNGSKLMVL